MLTALECIAAVLSWAATANMLGNTRAYRRLSSFADAPLPEPAPFVSVLVPARDEAANIVACVRSLLAQDYPCFEVLVLDDGSGDDTAALVCEIAATDTRLSLLTGDELPSGWMGKGFACHQLAAAARGDVLLFTDADTRHEAHMLRSVVGAMAAGADVVTAFPEQEIGSAAEALTVPLMLFTVWAFLPVGKVWDDPSPIYTAANGQLLAFTRAAYERVGGHAAVHDSVLEDMHLGQRAKGAGLRLRLTDGTGTTRTRMYRSPGEVWRGFSKNAYALVGGSVPVALAVVGTMLLLYVLPPVVLLVGLLRKRRGMRWRWLPLLLVGLMLVQRAILARRANLPAWQGVLHPFSVLAFVAVLANSVRWQRRGYGVWKGRAYATTPPPPPPTPASSSGVTAAPRGPATSPTPPRGGNPETRRWWRTSSASASRATRR